MGKKQREMSEYEYSQADKFIRHLYFRYGKGWITKNVGELLFWNMRK